MLRRLLAKDSDHFARWKTQGEWLLFDAPWEESTNEEKSDQDQSVQKRNGEEESRLEKRAIIATPDNIPLGWVNRYGEKKNPYVWFVGIDICEDTFLNRGLGTEALRLWVDYLFSVSEIHKISLDTWSFNPRMIRIAEKVGFMYEGRQREMRHWQGEWLDLLHFGILRDEWKSLKRVANYELAAQPRVERNG